MHLMMSHMTADLWPLTWRCVRLHSPWRLGWKWLHVGPTVGGSPTVGTSISWSPILMDAHIVGSSQTLCRSVLKLVFIVWVCMVGVYGGCVCVCVWGMWGRWLICCLWVVIGKNKRFTSTDVIVTAKGEVSCMCTCCVYKNSCCGNHWCRCT